MVFAMFNRMPERLWQSETVAVIALLLVLVAGSTAEGVRAATPVSAPVVASAEDFALRQLVAVLQQTNSVQAAVDQLLLDQDGRQLQEISARLVMQKPANFRWQTIKPYEELMVTDGRTIWRYEPDLGQVTIGAFNSKLDRTPVMLLNGTEQTIGNSYAVSYAKLTDGVHQQFVLQPKQPDSLFASMTLTFNGAVLEEMHFEDSLGQQTSLTFKVEQRNQAMDPGLFHFAPPKGVEVIDNTHN